MELYNRPGNIIYDVEDCTTHYLINEGKNLYFQKGGGSSIVVEVVTEGVW